jgi:serine/threonine protein kinase
VQLLRAVLHMHAAGFCHRDIKPENCMVERATQRLKVGCGQAAAKRNEGRE